jgi:CRP/FNR family transcriptional regulator, polysaccharide utilization system transcription regulator
MEASKYRSGFSEECQSCGSRHKSIFCHLGIEELGTFNDTKSCISFKKGQVIFNEGNHPLGLYCVREGKIKLSHSGQDGKDQIVRMAKNGDVLGYRAMISGERYTASAVALDDSNICFIPRDSFFSVLKTNSGLSMEIIKMLSSDLRKAEQTITDIAQKPVRERMAEALLFLKETYGFEEDGATINVVLSREDIANLVGTATETAIRLLSEFKQDKIVEAIGKKIKLLDVDKLIKTANIYN